MSVFYFQKYETMVYILALNIPKITMTIRLAPKKKKKRNTYCKSEISINN